MRPLALGYSYIPEPGSPLVSAHLLMTRQIAAISITETLNDHFPCDKELCQLVSIKVRTVTGYGSRS